MVNGIQETTNHNYNKNNAYSNSIIKSMLTINVLYLNRITVYTLDSIPLTLV